MKHVGGKKHSDLKTKTFKEIQVLYERLKRQDQNFVAIGSAKDERQIKELNKDPKKKRVIKETPRKEDTTKVHVEQEVTEQGTKKRKSGHVKGDLKIMMESSTEENDQELAIPEQTTTGKGIPNPLMAGSLSKTTKPTYHIKIADGGSVQLGDNRTCTIKGTWKLKIQLHDGSSLLLKDVRYVPGLKRSLISLDTLEKDGYTVKMQMSRINVIKGCRVMMTGIRKKNFGFKQLGHKQVGFKQLGHKQVGFKQLGPGVETGVHGVHDEKRWLLKRLEDKQLEEKTNTDCLVKEQEKVHLGIKVGANIMVTGVPGQEGAEGNVAEKKKVKESMEANLGKLLKYNAWSTR
ncbi:hypothetical protein Tco_0295110 [Tanacetum coccineum]